MYKTQMRFRRETENPNPNDYNVILKSLLDYTTRKLRHNN